MAMKSGLRRLAGRATLVGAAIAGTLAIAPAAHASCGSPVNEVEAENCKPGTSSAIWDVPGAGDTNIQGFATDISVDQGGTVGFKIDTDASAYRLDIYRLGYYGGDGARKVTDTPIRPPAIGGQPPCGGDASLGLVDCANWTTSATWQAPADATSGIYFAHAVREDGTPGESHIVFIVRDDDGRSDVLFQTSDTTWQAYNRYGGFSLYTPDLGTRAKKVSYNRPSPRAATPGGLALQRRVSDDPLARAQRLRRLVLHGRRQRPAWRRAGGAPSFLSVGHDEYWSGQQRANVEAARGAGVHMAFLSGNEVFWKTRWEDGHRTLVSYKETLGDAVDPSSTWTGTWRDERMMNSEGPNPENALTGTIFKVNDGTSEIEVPAADGRLRLWRNTSLAGLAGGDSRTLGSGTLGYEWDADLDNGARPAGLVRLSTAPRSSGIQVLLDQGANYGSGSATHHLTLYRHASGALVFGAGTVQWAWGLDANHDRGSGAASPEMQQAMVNLFADMDVQPGGLQPGLEAAAASTDYTPPTSQATSISLGNPATAGGVAADTGGGRVGAVEVSTDGGASWHPAEGRESWTYSWVPPVPGAPVTVLTRAADDSANLVPRTPGPGTPPPRRRRRRRGHRRRFDLRLRPRCRAPAAVPPAGPGPAPAPAAVPADPARLPPPSHATFASASGRRACACRAAAASSCVSAAPPPWCAATSASACSAAAASPASAAS